MADLLSKLKEEKTEVLINAGQDENKEGNVLEEGEEPAFTLAEEVKRQMRREERKRKKEELFKTAKDTCECLPPILPPHFNNLSSRQTCG